MLAQAISSTKPTAPNITSIGVSASPTSSCCSGTSVAPVRCVTGPCAASAIRLTSASACSRVTPGARRA